MPERLARARPIFDRLLLSQDNGWYSVGAPGGGSVAPYTPLLTTLVPALREAGLPGKAVRQLLTQPPGRALAVRR
ncbi:MAG: hypothetical protein ABEL97_04845 [Salinibacter sp.]